MRLTPADCARLRAAMDLIGQRADEGDPTLNVAPRILRDHGTSWQEALASDPDLYQLLADWHVAYVTARTKKTSRRFEAKRDALALYATLCERVERENNGEEPQASGERQEGRRGEREGG